MPCCSTDERGGKAPSNPDEEKPNDVAEDGRGWIWGRCGVHCEQIGKLMGRGKAETIIDVGADDS